MTTDCIVVVFFLIETAMYLFSSQCYIRVGYKHNSRHLESACSQLSINGFYNIDGGLHYGIEENEH